MNLQRKVHFLYAKNLPAEIPGYGLGVASPKDPTCGGGGGGGGQQATCLAVKQAMEFPQVHINA